MVEMKRLAGLLLVLFAVSGCAVQYDNVTVTPMAAHACKP